MLHHSFVLYPSPLATLKPSRPQSYPLEYSKILSAKRIGGGKGGGKTTYLLAGEEAGSKIDKATKLGVQVIDEAKFREMIA